MGDWTEQEYNAQERRNAEGEEMLNLLTRIFYDRADDDLLMLDGYVAIATGVSMETGQRFVVPVTNCTASTATLILQGIIESDVLFQVEN